MALVTTAQFPDLVPDATALGRGAMQTIQMQQALQQSEANKQQMADQEQQKEFRSIAIGAIQARNIPTIEGKIKFLETRNQEILDRGGNPSDTQQVLNLLKQGKGQEANQLLDSAIQTAERFGVIHPLTSEQVSNIQFGAQQTFKDEAGNLFFGTTKRNPSTGEIESALAPIGTEVSSPVGKVSLVSSLGETAVEQIETEAQKMAAREAAKLRAQFKLKPEVESAVKTAIAEAEANVKKSGEIKSNELALNVYDTAMSGLTESLGGTTTGPIAGWLPAVTENQRIADGAIAAMAPVLKQMFRSAGEGTFTDSDQRLLMEMLPTRRDGPEARKSKIENIDAIVRAKLGRTESTEMQTQQSQEITTQSELTPDEQRELEELRRRFGSGNP